MFPMEAVVIAHYGIIPSKCGAEREAGQLR